ncbi:MAG: hypothetical protein ACTHU0_23470 [Kofleriaceae bacterium]
MKNLALAVREGVPAELMRDWHLMICEGKSPLLRRRGTGWSLEAEEQGMIPTLDQRTRSMVWLAERGYGLPAQQIHLEAELRAQVAAIGQVPVVASLDTGKQWAIREILRGCLPAPSSDQPVIDVPAGDESPEPASTDLEPTSE